MGDRDFADLIERARSGDESAISILLAQFESQVRAVVRVRLPRSMRNQFDSMDFVQSVWTSVLPTVLARKGDEVGTFADAGHFRGYLAGVARNKIFEEHRRLTRTKKYDLAREERLYVRKGEREVPIEVAANQPSASEKFQERDRLEQLTEGLSPEETQIVQLRREGRTFEEIAGRLGVSERSVRRLIEEIRKRMEARQWR
jgi:RNA polymerase sigma-70 factor (ECF subfamily)